MRVWLVSFLVSTFLNVDTENLKKTLYFCYNKSLNYFLNLKYSKLILSQKNYLDYRC